MPASDSSDAKSQPYQVFMLALCLYALGVLTADSFFSLDPSTRTILEYTDNAVCGLFFLDFVISLIRAPSRWQYLYTWGWIDLASSIPSVDVLRWGRAARILRIFRVLRGVRATKLLASFILDRRAQGAFLAAALVSILLIIFSSVAILQFEAATDGNIKTAEDALWWAFTTITTVGYGDRYPVTPEGRIVAVLLMTAGVGLFGTFSGFVAAWFLAPEAKQQENELESLLEELRRIRKLLEQQEPKKLGRTPSPESTAPTNNGPPTLALEVSPPEWLRGDSTFSLEAVGEAKYQAALEEICGGRTEDGADQIVAADLVLEDTNPYDKNAVQVRILGKTVGYLSRADAKAFRERLMREAVTVEQFQCKANIRGGWERGDGSRGNFGIRLDVCLYEE